MAGKTGQNKVRKQAVNDFLIWRVGNSVGWDCTLADLAGETGLHIQTVGATCRRRGWEPLNGRTENNENRIDVLSMMRGMNNDPPIRLAQREIDAQTRRDGPV
jgi:hypothetical protein